MAKGNIFSTSLQAFFGSLLHRTEQAGVKLGGVWDGVKCHTEVKTSLNLNRHRPPGRTTKTSSVFSLLSSAFCLLSPFCRRQSTGSNFCFRFRVCSTLLLPPHPPQWTLSICRKSKTRLKINGREK